MSGYFSKKIFSPTEIGPAGEKRWINIDVKLTLITNSYNNTTQRNDQLLRSQEEKEKRLSVANKITDQKSLTKELVDLLIDQVSVFPNNQIEIAWKIKNFA